MKKALALVIVMCLFAIPAIGETVDVSTMSVEELEALRDTIETELEKRGVTEEREIGSGVYVVGTAIKEGMYELVCIAVKNNLCAISHYTNYENDPKRESFSTGKANSKFMIDLKAGDALEIQDAVFLIKPYEPIGLLD